MKKFRSFFTVFFLFLPLLSNTQDGGDPPFGKAPVEGIEGKGFYRLSVPPRLQKYCKLKLQDLRIMEGSGPEAEELPYLLDEQASFQKFVERRELRILKRESLKEGGGLVTLEDTATKGVTSLALEVDQGTVSRSIRITGSDDKKNWKELHPFQRVHDERFPDGNRGFILRDLNLSPHRYYRIQVSAEGRGLDPSIMDATVMKVKKGWKSYDRVPVKDFQVIQKEKRTYIRPEFEAPSYRIDGIDLDFGEKDYFYRKGFLARGDPDKPDSLQKLASFDLVSHGEAQLRFKGFRSNDLLIVLQDGDLSPLQIQNLKAYQRDRPLFFRWSKSTEPQLLFGDRKAEDPDYQLPHFREQMPDHPQKVSVGKIEWEGPPLEEWVRTEEKAKKDSSYRILTTIGIILIWIFGVVVLVSIGLLLYKRIL